MKKMGYPTVPNSKTFYKNEWAQAVGQSSRNIDAAYCHAKKIGFPVIVKPNSGSQGSGVTLVYNKQEFYRAIRTVFENDRVALVQQKVEGRDYRLVVLDKKVISVYERLPLSVVGDGQSTILQLMKLKQKQFVASSRDTQLKFNDPRIKEKLKHSGMNFYSIPKQEQRVFLLDNANLSTGGDSIDVTEKTHSDFEKLAIQLTRDMGLRLCGVDLMIKGGISEKPKTFWVLEINSAPGLDHYAKTGKAQEKIVENLYLEVLKSMEKSG
ncbi:MAG: cyanophycin synthetase [Candidatus Magasanikbacteria bacterium]